MVKNLVIKRTSKNLTIEEFKASKARNRNEEPKKIPPRYINIDDRYRFVKTNKKYEKIDLNIAHYLKELKLLPYSYTVDNIGSFFVDELEQQAVINATPDFKEFYAKVYEDTRTLPLILVNLDKIVKILIEYMDRPYCKKSMLQLLPSLFRDVQKDCFPYFIKIILPKVIELLNQKDPETFENVFKAIAYGFKYFYEEIKKDFKSFYDFYKENLFYSRNKYIQRFSTESLSFIFRKLKQNEIVDKCNVIFDSILQMEDDINFETFLKFICELFFNAIKSVAGTFTHKATYFVDCIHDFVSKNARRRCVKTFIEDFLCLFLSHSKSQEDDDIMDIEAADAAANKKAHLSRDDLLKYLIELFLQTLSKPTEDVKLPELTNLICDVVIVITSFREGMINGQKVNATLAKLISKLSEIKENRQLNYYIQFSKLIKYHHGFVNESQTLQELTNALFAASDMTPEQRFHILLNLVTKQNERGYWKDQYINYQEELKANYHVKKPVYDYSAFLVFKKFAWVHILKAESGWTLASLYLFHNVHKYTNQKNQITVKECQQMSQADYSALEKAFDQLLKKDVKEIHLFELAKMELFLKYLRIVQLASRDEISQIIQKLQAYSVQFLKRISHFAAEKTAEQPWTSHSIYNKLYSDAVDKIAVANTYETFGRELSPSDANALLIQLLAELLSTIGCLLGNKTIIGDLVKGNGTKLAEYLKNVLDVANSLCRYTNVVKTLAEAVEALTTAINRAQESSSSAKLDSFFVKKNGQVYIKFEDIKDIFYNYSTQLTSPLTKIRLNYLKLLSQVEPLDFLENNLDDKTTLKGTCPAIELCLKIEALEVNLETEKEKQLNISKLKSYCDSGRLPLSYSYLVLCYMMGLQTECFLSAAAHNYEQFFNVFINIFAYYNKILNGHSAQQMELENTNLIELKLFDSDDDASNGFEHLVEEFTNDLYLERDEIDSDKVFRNLVECWSNVNKLYQKNFDKLFSLFEQYLSHEYYKRYPEDDPNFQFNPLANYQNSKDLNAEVTQNAIAANQEKESEGSKEKYHINLKLEMFLKLFSSASSLAKTAGKYDLTELFQTFLRKGNPKVQKHALECITRIQDNDISKYFVVWKKLADPKTFKDEMLAFRLDKELEEAPERAKKPLLEVSVSLLYPKIFEKKGRKKKSFLETNRTIIFNFFAFLNSQQLGFLINLLLRNYGLPFKNISALNKEQLTYWLSNVETYKLLSFASSLKNMIDQFGVIFLPYLSEMFELLTAAIHLSVTLRASLKISAKELKKSRGDRELDKEEETTIRVFSGAKKLFQACLKRISQIYQKYTINLESSDLTLSLYQSLQANIENLFRESSTSVSHLLKLFVVWSDKEECLHYFEQYNTIIPNIVKIYGQPKITRSVTDSINLILLRICEFATVGQELMLENNTIAQETAEKLLKTNLHLIVKNFSLFFKRNSLVKKRRVWRPDLKIIKILLVLSQYIGEHENIDDILTLFKPVLDPKYVNKAFTSRRTSDIQFGDKTEKTTEIIQHTFVIFSRLIKHSKAQRSYYDLLSSLLMNLAVEAPREHLVIAFDHLNHSELNLSVKTIEAIKAMNTYNRKGDRGLNYGEIVPAAYDANAWCLKSTRFEDKELLLCQYIFFLQLEELSVRLVATTSLKEYLKFVNTAFASMDEPDRQKNLRFITGCLIDHLIKGLRLFQEHQLKSHLEVLISCSLVLNDILQDSQNRAYIQTEEHLYLDLKSLKHTDPQQDFFENIFDVQNYKRMWAINAVNRVLKRKDETLDKVESEKILSVDSMKNVILPILRYQIMQKNLQENVLQVRSSQPQNQITHAKQLVQSMIETFSHCLRYFEWTDFYQVMKTTLARLNKNISQEEKVLVKLICANLNHLNIPCPNIIDIVKNAFERLSAHSEAGDLIQKMMNYDENRAVIPVHEGLELNKVQQKAFEEILEIENMEGIDRETILNPETYVVQNAEEDAELVMGQSSLIKALKLKILNPLKKHMHEKSKTKNEETKIRAYTAVAIAKLLCKFPVEIFNVEFPRIIQIICASMKSRDFEIRNHARRALSEILLVTGPYFFHYVVKEINYSMSLGYQIHIKNYTIYYLLNTLVEKSEKGDIEFKNGAIDYCLSTILDILFAEIFGQLQEEKEAKEVKKKTPEFKSAKAYDCFLLLAKVINFTDTAPFLINQVKLKLEEYSNDVRKANKCEEIFRKLVEGFAANKSLNMELLLITAFFLIHDSLENMMIPELSNFNESNIVEYSLSAEEFKKYNVQKKYFIQEGAAEGKSIFKLMQSKQKANKSLVGKTLTFFSINMILLCIKRNFLSISNEDFLKNPLKPQFEPLNRLIIDILKSSDSSIIANALKIWIYILKWPLETTKKNIKKIINGILGVIEKLTLQDTEMVKNSFKVLSVMLQLPYQINFSKKQLKLLMEYFELHMFNTDLSHEPIDCLNTFILKRIITPEVYDLVDKLEETMVKSYSQGTQTACKNVVMNFFVYYPISEKLLEKHLQFLLKNLEFNINSGRKAVIEVLSRLVEIIPQDSLKPHNTLIFYSVILRIVMEEDEELKELLIKIIDIQYNRVDEETRSKHAQHLLSFATDSKRGVQQAGIEGIAIHIKKGWNFSKNLDNVFKNFNRLLESEAQEIEKHWNRIREDIHNDKLKDSNNQFLLKLRLENSPKYQANLYEIYNISSTILRFAKVCVVQCPVYWNENIYSEQNQNTFDNFMKIFSLAREELITSFLELLQANFEQSSKQIMVLMQNGTRIFKLLAKRIVALLLKNFSSKQFTDAFFGVTKLFLKIVPSDETETFLLSVFEKLNKMLLKLLRVPRSNVGKVGRLLDYAYAILSAFYKENEMGEEVLIQCFKLYIKADNFKNNLKDAGVEFEMPILSMVFELIREKYKQDNFLKVYSNTQNQIEEAKLERKKQAKAEKLIFPEKDLENKKARLQRQKVKRKQKFEKYRLGETPKKVKFSV